MLNAGEDAEKQNHLYIAGSVWQSLIYLFTELNMCACVCGGGGGGNLNIYLPYDPTIALLGTYLRVMKHLCSYEDMYMNVRSSFLWNLEQTSIGEWFNQLQSIHTMDYYTVIKRNELVINATPWMDVQGTMRNEKGQFHLHSMLDMTQL